MAFFNYRQFYETEDLFSMKITDKISMSDIYLMIETQNFDKSGIKISYNQNDTFNLNYEQITLEYVFKKPIKLKIDNKELDIININHLRQLMIKYEILNPKINCKTCTELYEYNLTNLLNHKSHEILIEEGDKYVRISDNNFEDFFQKEKEGKKACLGKNFENPEKFEKNFKYYFKDYEIYKNKNFEVFGGEKRENFIDYFIQTLSLGCNKIQAFFGQSGMGKSISVLVALKYVLNHNTCGTLYLNMKCLNLLLKKKDHDILKQIIIDEIPYLFYHRYNYYLSCIKIIWHFSIENEDSIWDLILEIIEFIHTIPDNYLPYAFIFDQYNDEIDKNKKLAKIFNILQNKSDKRTIEIITLSSMNNKDIKLYKTNYIRHELDPNFQNQTIFDMKLEEVKDIFDTQSLKFEDKTFKEYYDLFGRNIKYYNILNDYFNNQKQCDQLIDTEKENIKNKIKKFYDCDSSKKNIVSLLYFSTKTKYDLNGFLEVVQYIPFKYFEPEIIAPKKEKKKNTKKAKTKIKSKKEEEEIYIKINYSFPLIEEIVSELIEYILTIELNIYKELCENKLIDGGARGQLFEKFVTIQLNPKVNHPNKKNFFKDVNIIDTITIKKFVPKGKEEIIKKKKLSKLKCGTYLFTQKILTGKDLDILIIDIDKNNHSEIMAFQITINKPEKKIFMDIYLQSCFFTLKKYLNSLYDFEIDEYKIYFAYIFDKSYENQNDFNDMINVCKKNHMPYIIFDPEKLLFYDENLSIIDTIRNHVTSPYDHSYLKRHSISDDDDFKDFDDFIMTIPKKLPFEIYHPINIKDKESIINILRNDTNLGNQIKDIQFNKSIILRQRSDILKKYIYIGRTKKTLNLFILYNSKKQNKMIHCFLDKQFEKKNENENVCDIYDLYEYIT